MYRYGRERELRWPEDFLEIVINFCSHNFPYFYTGSHACMYRICTICYSWKTAQEITWPRERLRRNRVTWFFVRIFIVSGITNSTYTVYCIRIRILLQIQSFPVIFFIKTVEKSRKYAKCVKYRFSTKVDRMSALLDCSIFTKSYLMYFWT